MHSDTSTNLRRVATKAFASFGARPELAGRTYMSLLRCSDDHQADTSPEGMKEVNDTFASCNGMRWCGRDMYAEGISGSQTFNREDLEQILRWKKEFNDFDTVLVFERGRATRGGIYHGGEVEKELRRAGIELVSTTEVFPDGPDGDLLKAIKDYTNQQQARAISKAVARGLAQSLAKAARPAASRTPYGLDRVYIDLNGNTRTIIRWEGNEQLRIDPVSKQVIGRVLCPPRRKPRKKGQLRERRARFIGYRKQDDERSRLEPGGGRSCEVLIEILRMYYCTPLGAHRIIKHLRSQGIPSPRGGDWNLSTIHRLVENPIYLGIEVRHRFTKALYNMLGRDGPVPVTVNQDILEKEERMSVPMRERSRDEWVLVDKPELKGFLPPDVREAMLTHIVTMLDADAVIRKQMRRQKRKDKHRDSLYVLSHILHSRDTQHPMRGETNTRRLKKGKKSYRYYFDYSTASKALSGLCARRVPADPLEEAVVPAIFESLLDHDWIAERVRDRVLALDAGSSSIDEQRTKLVAERHEVARRLARSLKLSERLTDEEIGGIIAEDQARQLAIRRELAELDRRSTTRAPSATEATQAVIERLRMIPTSWKELPREELKDFLKTVVDDLRIDLGTLETTLTIRVPEKAMNPLPKVDSNSRLTFTSAWPSSPDAGTPDGVKSHEIACRHDRRTKCYVCKRSRAAA